jgi:hypothetical protein
MPADAAGLRFFFDESALGVGKALEIARRDVIHTGHRLIPEVPYGTLDTEWMPIVASRDLVVIARDRRIRTKPGEIEQMRKHRLRVFWIAGKKDLSSWDELVRLVRRWDDIERIMRERPEGPWFMAVHDGQTRELGLPE